MDKVKHEIEAAIAWLKDGNVEQAKLHLGFALEWHNEEAAQHRVQRTGAQCWKCKRESVVDGYCRNPGCSEFHPRR